MTSEELKKVIETREEVICTGDTITFKKKLSSAGFKWDSNRKGWVGIVRPDVLSWIHNLDVNLSRQPVKRMTELEIYEDMDKNENSIY
jgi:hypothetical protein